MEIELSVLQVKRLIAYWMRYTWNMNTLNYIFTALFDLSRCTEAKDDEGEAVFKVELSDTLMTAMKIIVHDHLSEETKQ